MDRSFQSFAAVTALLGAGVFSAIASAESVGMPGALGSYAMTRDGSGTSWLPDTSPMEALHGAYGDWMTMLHGSLVLADTQQSGPRGAAATFSESMIMGSARRDIGDSAFTARAMMSADPINGAAGYPLLLQTGETANGRDPLVDRQHPHNLVMELALTYSKSLTRLASWFVYAAPVGEPALGPPVFMHRRSSDADPEAPLSHHHLDATHVSFGVVTAGLVAGRWKIEASTFNGREPDQHRSAFEWRPLDSWSTRLSFNPVPSLALQISTSRLQSPESLHPEIAVKRSTASVLHEASIGSWQASTTLAFGRNSPTAGWRTDAWLADEALRWGDGQVLYGRVERVGYDELPGVPELTQSPVIVKRSLGYQADIARWGVLRFSLGVVGSRFAIPNPLVTRYGVAPDSWTVYMRARVAP